MGNITDEQLNKLCIKVQGLEIVHLIGAPPESQWAVRGLRDSKEPSRGFDGEIMSYVASQPSEAVEKAIQDNQ